MSFSNLSRILSCRFSRSKVQGIKGKNLLLLEPDDFHRLHLISDHNRRSHFDSEALLDCKCAPVVMCLTTYCFMRITLCIYLYYRSNGCGWIVGAKENDSLIIASSFLMW